MGCAWTGLGFHPKLYCRLFSSVMLWTFSIGGARRFSAAPIGSFEICFARRPCVNRHSLEKFWLNLQVHARSRRGGDTARLGVCATPRHAGPHCCAQCFRVAANKHAESIKYWVGSQSFGPSKTPRPSPLMRIKFQHRYKHPKQKGTAKIR